jgi:hypothetical protein
VREGEEKKEKEGERCRGREEERERESEREIYKGEQGEMGRERAEKKRESDKWE